MEKTIRTIHKSQHQQIRVGLSEYTKDGEMFDMAYARVYFDDGGEYRPTRNGINVRVELLPELIEGLQKAAAEARAAGLLEGPNTEDRPQDDAAGADVTILSAG